VYFLFSQGCLVETGVLSVISASFLKGDHVICCLKATKAFNEGVT